MYGVSQARAFRAVFRHEKIATSLAGKLLRKSLCIYKNQCLSTDRCNGCVGLSMKKCSGIEINGYGSREGYGIACCL